MSELADIYNSLPGKTELISGFRKDPNGNIPDVNGHVHTPHSFSAFENISQAFQMAKAEGVKVMGINDFYTTDGYQEFAEVAGQTRIFPLFNIEFMALQENEQQQGIRVNDPNNPGRTYFSGKGLRYPVRMSEPSLMKMKTVQEESNHQTREMVDKLNTFLLQTGTDLHFDADEIQQKLAKNLLRERHIAKAIRMAVFEKYTDENERISCFEKLFSGKKVKSKLTDIAGIENEIRGNLLKAGGAAFVPEDPKAFLSLQEVKDLIVDAGGIPCYPVLLDDASGKFTDFEADKEKMLHSLLENNIYSIELIPGRNDYTILKDFVMYFHQHRFVITFGTEHNTPQLDPVKITCRGGVPLDDELLRINYEGAAVIAAHQYLLANGEEGYLDGDKAKLDKLDEFIELGKAVISAFTK